MKVVDGIITPFNEATFLNLYSNYDNPYATKIINGIIYKIAYGLPIDNKLTYILYKGSHFVGTYNSFEEAKEFVP